MATKPKLMVDGVTGKVAIFTIDDSTPNDRAPLDAPNSYLSRLLFHSDLQYPRIVYKISSTLALPSRSANVDQTTATHTLFPHGLSGQPLVLGVITGISGNPVPLAGSVPYQIDQYGFGRWLSLGSDATNVKIAESYVTHRSGGISSETISYTVWVTDFLLDRSTPMPTPTSEMLFIDPSRFRAGGGKFNASNRYIRTAHSGKEFAVVQGPSVTLQPVGSIGASVSRWRYSVDGYAVQQTNADGGNQGPLPVSGLSFDASVVAARTE